MRWWIDTDAAQPYDEGVVLPSRGRSAFRDGARRIVAAGVRPVGHPSDFYLDVDGVSREKRAARDVAFAAGGFRWYSLVSGNRLLAAKIGAIDAQRFSLLIAGSGSLTVNRRWIEPPYLNLLMR